MNNKIVKIIKNNDIHITIQDIVEILIHKYNLKDYIKSSELHEFDNDTLGLYNFDSKVLYINKKIINILRKYYEKSKKIKENMTEEEFIIFEILQTIIHESIHANQNKIILESKGIIHKVYKDIIHTPGRLNELYNLDPLEKDANLTSYEVLFPYYKENKKIYNYIKNVYQNKIIYHGYLNNDLKKGSLEKIYKLFLLKEERFEKLKNDLNNLDTIEKIHLNYSLNEEEIINTKKLIK